MSDLLFEEDFFKSNELEPESGVLMKTRGVAHPEGHIRTKKNGKKVQKVGGKWVAYKGGSGKTASPKKKTKKPEPKKDPEGVKKIKVEGLKLAGTNGLEGEFHGAAKRNDSGRWIVFLESPQMAHGAEYIKVKGGFDSKESAEKKIRQTVSSYVKKNKAEIDDYFGDGTADKFLGQSASTPSKEGKEVDEKKEQRKQRAKERRQKKQKAKLEVKAKEIGSSIRNVISMFDGESQGGSYYGGEPYNIDISPDPKTGKMTIDSVTVDRRHVGDWEGDDGSGDYDYQTWAGTKKNKEISKHFKKRIKAQPWFSSKKYDIEIYGQEKNWLTFGVYRKRK
jgi:hypothetical protein